MLLLVALVIRGNVCVPEVWRVLTERVALHIHWFREQTLGLVVELSLYLQMHRIVLRGRMDDSSARSRTLITEIRAESQSGA
jgi:hypothetical protein